MSTTKKTDRAAPARAALAQKRKAGKLKPKPQWEGDGGTDRYEKFRAKGLHWQPDESEDRLTIDQNLLNNLRREGVVLQWVTQTVYGKEFPHEFARYERGGWVRVEPRDIDGIDVTEIDGLVLMARPVEIDNKAKRHEAQKAAAVIATKRESLIGGVIPGISLDAGHPTAVRSNKINRTYERISIPGDED